MTSPDLHYPFPEAPQPGTAIEIAPGLLWARLALPFRLDHVNVYLVRDGEGWAIVDTGVDNETTREQWRAILRDSLGGAPITRIIVTHYHVDHVGAAAFLCELTGAPLVMGEIEYLTARAYLAPPPALNIAFYRRQGLADAQIAPLEGKWARFGKSVPALPASYAPLREGDTLQLGERQFRVFMFAGHSPAQVMLFCAQDKLLLAADHVIARISPNIGVNETKPHDDPLGLYLRSFDVITDAVPADTLVLSGHRLPFHGLHIRLADLAAHHEERCALIVATCRQTPGLSAAMIMPKLFPREMDAQQSWSAFSETLAHINYLAANRRIYSQEDAGITGWFAP